MNQMQLTHLALKIFFEFPESKLKKMADEIGKANNIIVDEQTYSFRYKHFVHYSEKLVNRCKCPNLDKSLHERGDLLIEEVKDVESFKNLMSRMLSFIFLSKHPFYYLNLLPTDLKDLLIKYSEIVDNGVPPEQEIQRFNIYYADTLEQLYNRLMFNMLEI